jgi:hypothetical protein
MKLREIAQTSMLALLLAGAAEAQIPNFTPPTPLIGAVMHDDTAEAKRLLANGADPNEGRLIGFSPVFLSVIHHNKDIFHALRANGAKLDEKDPSGSTLLMWAAYNDQGDAEIVDELLKLGMDPNVTNKTGETALTWAMGRGQTPVVASLERAGASNQAAVREAAQKAVDLLQKSAPQFVRVSGCVSCHNTLMPAMAASLARTRGIHIEEKTLHYETEATVAVLKPARDAVANNPDMLPDPPVTLGYVLLGLAADNYPADDLTDVMVQTIMKWQRPDGGFHAMPMRPPIEGTDFAATALSLRGMQLYGKNSEERVARAAAWLKRATPHSAEDAAMRLMGMSWAGASQDDLGSAESTLLDQQRPDGGWAQLPGLETDAYATGMALVALSWSGQMAPSAAAYQSGIGYLLRTQYADGSWLVRTRSFPVQPYKESGYPFGKDQWISAQGSSWAAMALTLSLPEQTARSTANLSGR